MTQNKSRYPDEQNLKDHYGWVIPDFYSDPKTEFLAAQNDAVVHDSSYVGRLKATGPDTLDFLNRMSTNQLINLALEEFLERLKKKLKKVLPLI